MVLVAVGMKIQIEAPIKKPPPAWGGGKGWEGCQGIYWMISTEQ